MHLLEVIREALRVLAEVAVVLGVGMAIKIYSEMLKAKKAENELLRSRVAHLEKLAAPALAEQLEKMAPILNRYAAEIAELREKEGKVPEALQRSESIGILKGTLETILTVNAFLSARAIAAGLADEAPPSYAEELKEFLNAELMPIGAKIVAGETPELKRLKKVLIEKKRAALKPR